MRTVEVFDTTLRDGLQVEGVSATVDDKLRIAEQLDLLGVHYIEGGWPGANPKDIEFFQRARTELDKMGEDSSLQKASLPALFSRLAAGGADVRVIYVAGYWLDVDDAFDLAKARDVH